MKKAAVEVDLEFLGDCATILKDHGLSIVRAEPIGDRFYPPYCLLTIAGDGIPDNCDGQVVKLTIREEQYGRQRLRRVHEFHPCRPMA